jgi:hypothetical protein
MDERNTVQFFDIVPFDSRDYMRNAFELIWGTPNRQVTTQAVYTDNCKSDKNILLACFHSFKQHENCSLDVLQDIWHALQRVLKCMPKNHADYKEAKKDLKTLFAKLNKPEAYPEKTGFVTALTNWLNTYSSASVAQKLPPKEQVTYLG